jgi:coenzyme F420 hydrogenase subunit beta
MLAIEEAFSKNRAPIAVVGVPCQVDGLRSIQHGGVYGPIAKWYRNNVALTIGLFCSEAFVYEGIVDLAKQLGISVDDIKYFNIKGKVIIKTEKQEYEFPLKDFRKYARPACEFCKDYSAELADIGLGGIGLSGWTMTITRTAAGQKFIDDAIKDGYLETRSLADAQDSLELLKRLCRKKRQKLPILKLV